MVPGLNEFEAEFVPSFKTAPMLYVAPFVVTGDDHNIKSNDFSIALPIGTYNDRFSLRFSGNMLGVNNPSAHTEPLIYFTNSNQTLNIKNTNINKAITAVSLFNVLGQLIDNYDVSQENQEEIQLPIQNIAAGTYIVKVSTENGTGFSKKIIKN
jgi:hypothetical protein